MYLESYLHTRRLYILYTYVCLVSVPFYGHFFKSDRLGSIRVGAEARHQANILFVNPKFTGYKYNIYFSKFCRRPRHHPLHDDAPVLFVSPRINPNRRRTTGCGVCTRTSSCWPLPAGVASTKK